MKLIYKSLNKVFIISLLVSLGYSETKSTILDSISTALYKNGSTEIEATMEQKQSDKDWTDFVTVEIIDSTKFIFIASNQIIKVDSDTVFTFTPITNQVVIDFYYRNEFNILSLLSGNMRQIKLGNIQKRVRDTIVNFTIPQIESRGKIWVNSISYHPIRIVLEDDLDNYTGISIDSFKPLSYPNQYENYVTEDWEIIDLRE